MSEEKPEPALAAGKDIVRFCPLDDCGARFAEPVATNVKHTCPKCKKQFQVFAD